MRFIIGLIMLLFSTQSYADLGGCVVYKIKYVLKDGSAQTGFLPLSGYDDFAYLDENTKTNKYCGDKEFQILINNIFYKQRNTLKFEIYTALHLVDFGRSANQAHSPNPVKCAFTDSSSVIQLHLDSIKYTIFLSAKAAEWNYPEVQIKLVDSETSLMMQKNTVVNYTILSHPPVLEKPGSKYMHEFEQYFVLNYNKNISLEDLKKEMHNISEEMYGPALAWITSQGIAKEKVPEPEKQNTQIALINRLRQKGIILIKIRTTC